MAASGRLLKISVACWISLSATALLAQEARWPQFRGAAAAGHCPTPAPQAWDVSTGKGVAWKTEIPGLGHSCPVIWDDRIFVTTAVGLADQPASLRVGLYGDIAPVNESFEHEWRVLCLDRATGKVLWNQLAHKGVPKIKRHTKASHANSTPATDGQHVAAFFGAEGLYCFDMAGKLLWSKDLGTLDSGYFMVPTAQWGFASSPVIFEGKLLVQCDVQKDSFIAAFDVKTGEELWRTARRDVPTWSTPSVVEAGGRKIVVANGFKEIAGYDLQTGERLWHLSGGGDIPVPTPVAAHGMVYIASAHGPAAPLLAVRPGAKGELKLPAADTGSRDIAWHKARVGVYMQTPLVLGDEIYACRDNGVLNVFDARSGELRYRKRLGSGRTGFTASPIAAGDLLYFTSEEGDVYVLRAGPAFEQVAVNSLGEVCMATPAVADGTLYFRTQAHLIAVR